MRIPFARTMLLIVSVAAVRSSVCFAVSPDSLQPIRAALVEIWKAAEIYKYGSDNWPVSIDVLVDSAYLEFDSGVAATWKFGFDSGPLLIRATSIRSHREFQEGDSVDVHDRVMYDVLRGTWSEGGFSRSIAGTTSAATRAELSAEARTMMRAIFEASRVYYADKGTWAETVETLDKEKYIGLSWSPGDFNVVSPAVYSQWNFALIGTPPQRVMAISTGQMPGGSGHWIEYDVATGIWSGYGTTTPADSSALPVRRHEFLKKSR